MYEKDTTEFSTQELSMSRTKESPWVFLLKMDDNEREVIFVNSPSDIQTESQTFGKTGDEHKEGPELGNDDEAIMGIDEGYDDGTTLLVGISDGALLG
mmetsp:Transcript_29658/g.61872  ORF Transcript_29658/g.61872 Transcript_29658/m.61872 type:complete len:98 (+) Transcript_29658:460-753(+)